EAEKGAELAPSSAVYVALDTDVSWHRGADSRRCRQAAMRDGDSRWTHVGLTLAGTSASTESTVYWRTSARGRLVVKVAALPADVLVALGTRQGGGSTARAAPPAAGRPAAVLS